MSRTITVGVDGSAESRAAAEWAAREARLRGLPVKLVQVWQPVPEPMAEAPLLGADTHQHWTERILREAADALRSGHPGLEVSTEQLTGQPAELLTAAAGEAELLVLGSRGLGGLGGFLLGSVGQAVVAHSERPVVLIRSGEQEAVGEHGTAVTGDPAGPVVLGLDVRAPDAAPIEFAFEAAERGSVPLRVVHAWNPPSYYYSYGMAMDPEVTTTVARAHAAALDEALRPWRQKHPGVEVVTESRWISPSLLLVEASRGASLVVVGRRVRRSPVGAHIGTVAHAVLHHAAAPVAVVAHD
ncbi:universal stress protein [Streptomyces cellostaticus]|uniref:universal stress protein n=1 Tax=Streptomyces cellostaticus TaxID=67285 RepID=UPI0020260C6E|nr:universal stress protein [Streptomyces cellostaticus]